MQIKVLIFMLFMSIAGTLYAQSAPETPAHLLGRLKKMPADTARITILLELAEAYTFMPAQKDSRSDSVELLLKEARQLNNIFKINKFRNHIDILSAQTKISRNGNVDVKAFLIPIIVRCHKTGDIANECLAWQILARNLDHNPKSELFKLNYYQQALLLARKANDPQSALNVNRSVADINLRLGNFSLAENQLLQIIKPEQQASHTNLLFAYDALSGLYIQKGNYQKALAYALKTIKMMQTAADSAYAFSFYSRVAKIHKDLGNLSQSLEWSKKAYSVVLRANENFSLLIAAKTGVIDALLALKRPEEALKIIPIDHKKFKSLYPGVQRVYLIRIGDTYHALKKHVLAEKSYLELISLIQHNKEVFSKPVIASSYQRIGNFYLSTNRPGMARPYLLEALKNYGIAGSMTEMKDIFLLLFEAESAGGNDQQAMHYLQKSNSLKDSIFNAVKNKQIQELQMTFDTEQKNKDINALQAAATLQKASLKNAESSRNWIFLGTCLLVIIAILLYRQSLVTQKNNQLIQKKNQTLERFLKEKDWLIKEVHHRVKNNLHTLICLLESQAKYLKDDALKAVETSQNRIFAMSLIHQKLYRSEDVKAINMAEYVPELIYNLERSFDLSDEVTFDIDIAPILLNVSYAIPFGLIINEAVTNSIKYAFPAKRKGTISAAFHQYDKEVILTIADDGIGMPHDFGEQPNQSMGIELMKGLCQDINGEICIQGNNGTRIVVTCGLETNSEHAVPVDKHTLSFAMPPDVKSY